MLGVIIGRQTWNCQIRSHIHTKHTPKKEKGIGKVRGKKERKGGQKEGGGLGRNKGKKLENTPKKRGEGGGERGKKEGGGWV